MIGKIIAFNLRGRPCEHGIHWLFSEADRQLLKPVTAKWRHRCHLTTSARDRESISREPATMVFTLEEETRLDLGSTLARDISGNLCPRPESATGPRCFSAGSFFAPIALRDRVDRHQDSGVLCLRPRGHSHSRASCRRMPMRCSRSISSFSRDGNSEPECWKGGEDDTLPSRSKRYNSRFFFEKLNSKSVPNCI